MFGGLFCNGNFFVYNIPDESVASIKVMQEAILSDTKAAQNQDNKRATQLLNLATAQADKQTRRNARQADFMGNIGYECRKCGMNPVFCTCDYII